MFAASWQTLGDAVAGIFVAGGYTLVRLGLREICNRIRSEKDRKQTVHHDDLRVLATSSNFQLRRSDVGADCDELMHLFLVLYASYLRKLLKVINLRKSSQLAKATMII
jgi:hypothetical protein